MPIPKVKKARTEIISVTIKSFLLTILHDIYSLSFSIDLENKFIMQINSIKVTTK